LAKQMIKRKAVFDTTGAPPSGLHVFLLRNIVAT
ncbi:MAG: hypothetical protein ACI9UK_002597, partial [Candidatus Krumholzibacteriia bacterium]